MKDEGFITFMIGFMVGGTVMAGLTLCLSIYYLVDLNL